MKKVVASTYGVDVFPASSTRCGSYAESLSLDITPAIEWAITHPASYRIETIDDQILKHPAKSLSAVLKLAGKPVLTKAQQKTLNQYLKTLPAYKAALCEFLQILTNMEKEGRTELVSTILAEYPGTANWACADGAVGELRTALRSFQDPFFRHTECFATEYVCKLDLTNTPTSNHTHLPPGLLIVLGYDLQEIKNRDKFAYPTLMTMSASRMDNMRQAFHVELQRSLDELVTLLTDESLRGSREAMIKLNPVAQWLAPCPTDGSFNPDGWNPAFRLCYTEDGEVLTPSEQLEVLNVALVERGLLAVPGGLQRVEFGTVEDIFRPGGMAVLTTVIDVVNHPSVYDVATRHRALELATLLVEDFVDRSPFVQRRLAAELMLPQAGDSFVATDVVVQNRVAYLSEKIAIIHSRKIPEARTLNDLILQNAPYDVFENFFAAYKSRSGSNLQIDNAQLSELFQLHNSLEVPHAIAMLSPSVRGLFALQDLENLATQFALMEPKAGNILRVRAGRSETESSLTKMLLVDRDYGLKIARHLLANLTVDHADPVQICMLFEILLNDRPASDEVLKKAVACFTSSSEFNSIFPKELMEHLDLLLLFAPSDLVRLYCPFQDLSIVDQLSSKMIDVLFSKEIVTHIGKDGLRKILGDPRSSPYNFLHFTHSSAHGQCLYGHMFNPELSPFTPKERCEYLAHQYNRGNVLHRRAEVHDTALFRVLSEFGQDLNTDDVLFRLLTAPLYKDDLFPVTVLTLMKKHWPARDLHDWVDSLSGVFTSSQMATIRSGLFSSSMCVLQ